MARERTGLSTEKEVEQFLSLKAQIQSRDSRFEGVMKKVRKPPTGPAALSNAASHRNAIHSHGYTPVHHGHRSSFNPLAPPRNM